MKRLSVVAIVCAHAVLACGNDDYDSIEQRMRREHDQDLKAIADLARSFNASTDWDDEGSVITPEFTAENERLRKSGQPTKPLPRFNTFRFTLDLEQALIRPDGRPVLLVGAVEDIQGDPSAPVLLVGSSHGLITALQCSPEQIARYRNANVESVAVVAQIQSLVPAQAMRAKFPCVDDDSKWVALGTCLDLEPIQTGDLFYPLRRRERADTSPK
jgi:hypothetical protein